MHVASKGNRGRGNNEKACTYQNKSKVQDRIAEVIRGGDIEDTAGWT